MRVRLRSTNTKKSGPLKCDACSKVFQTDHGLITHKNVIHKVKKKTIEKAVTKPKTAIKIDNTINLSQILNQPTVQLNKLVEIALPVKVDTNKSGGKIEIASEADSHTLDENLKNIKYECPYCFKSSGKFDTTLSHIVESHTITKNGNQTSEESKETAELRKPIVLMTCNKCNLAGRCNDPHVCKSEINIIKCAACELSIDSKLFNNHVQGEHTTGLERFFFPNYFEFQNWKKDLQAHTNSQYFLTNRCHKKQYYRCCKLILTKDKQNCERLVCPSLIITQDFPFGLQVLFYKNHYKHWCTTYKVTEKDKKYSITELFNTTTEYDDIAATLQNDGDDEKDLYVQFRKLMESIVINAAKLKVETLNILHGKALEMTAILTNYDDDEETDLRDTKYFQITQTKALNDNEISKALEGFKKSEITKRKINTKTNQTLPNRRESSKRQHVDTIVPEITALRHETPKRSVPLTENRVKDTEDNNTKQNDTLESNNSSILENILTVKNNENSMGIKSKSKNNSTEIKSHIEEKTKVSFNDSYREFVDRQSSHTSQKNTPVNVKVSKAKGTHLEKVNKVNHTDLKSKNNTESKIKIIKVESITTTNENIPTTIKSPQPESKIKIINVESLNKNENTQVKTKDSKAESKIKIIKVNKAESKIKIIKVKSKNNNTQLKTKNIKAQLKTKNNNTELKSKNKNTESKSKNKDAEIKSKKIYKEIKASKSIKDKASPKNVIVRPKVVKTPKISKKGIIRTKLGHYSPKLAKPEEKEPIIATPSKVDKYEVMEQEDDCNILILKF